MMTKVWLAAWTVCVGLSSGLAFAEDEVSTIAVPIRVSLGDIGAYANVPGRLPAVLHHGETPQTCVEPEQACTKVPEFRGLKVTFRNRCVEISPRIDCTVTENVRREGPIRISGKGAMIQVSQNIYGSGTVRGRGDIGRHIHQTVRARAEFTIKGRPTMRPDWTLAMPMSLSFRWIDRPEFRLFNLFPVSVGSKVEPPLREALQKYERETLPREISKIDLRSEAARLWHALQDPIPIDLDGERLFLHVEPISMGLDGPRFDGNALTARLALSSRFRLNDDGTSPPTRVPLPNLTPVPEAGYKVTLPISIRLETLAAQVALPAIFKIEGPIPADISVTSLRLLGGTDGRLQAVLEIDSQPTSEVFNQIRYLGAVTVIARPVYDPESGLVRFEEPELARGTPKNPQQVLGLAVGSGVIGQWLLSELTYDTGPELQRAEAALNAALNREIAKGLRISGWGNLELSGLSIEEDALALLARSIGEVRVVGFNPSPR